MKQDQARAVKDNRPYRIRKVAAVILNRLGLGLVVASLFLTGCQTKPTAPAASAAPSKPVETLAQPQSQPGHAIIVAGQAVPIGTRVVTWKEPIGFNAYQIPPAAAGKTSTPYENHGVRRPPSHTSDEPHESATPLDLATLREIIDQCVLHYDTKGSSQQTFGILQKRGLSAHFLLDVDGTIYQTLDLRERAYHATIANGRSIGIEMANPGAYPPGENKVLAHWQHTQRQKVTDPRFRPAHPALVRGKIHGQELEQYDFTPAQYAALGKLMAALHRVFPKLALDYPHGDHNHEVLTRVLSTEEFTKFRGFLAHFHIQANKIDPGPAFQWDLVIEEARSEIER